MTVLRRSLALIALLWCAALPASAAPKAAHAKRAAKSAAVASPAPAPDSVAAAPALVLPADAVTIEVERVKPMKEKHPTLRFLRENRDFIRAELDRVREKTIAQSGDAAAIDPRFLAYQQLLAGALAAKDSVALADDARERRDLLASVTGLGALESELDQLDRLLADQRARLGVLQRDFVGDQQTMLAIVLSASPLGQLPAQVALALEDGTQITVPLSAADRLALRTGGVVQVFHGFVEPREQVLAVTVACDGWSATAPGYLTLDPARDRLTMLRLDLSHLDPAEGAPSLAASAWLHDERMP